MLASIQIIIHLAAFILIVRYKNKCRRRDYRMDAGVLAFLLAGFNLSMIAYLVTIQPNHAAILDYLLVGLASVVLAVVARFGGNTAKIIDWVKSRLA